MSTPNNISYIADLDATAVFAAKGQNVFYVYNGIIYQYDLFRNQSNSVYTVEGGYVAVELKTDGSLIVALLRQSDNDLNFKVVATKIDSYSSWMEYDYSCPGGHTGIGILRGNAYALNSDAACLYLIHTDGSNPQTIDLPDTNLGDHNLSDFYFTLQSSKKYLVIAYYLNQEMPPTVWKFFDGLIFHDNTTYDQVGYDQLSVNKNAVFMLKGGSYAVDSIKSISDSSSTAPDLMPLPNLTTAVLTRDSLIGWNDADQSQLWVALLNNNNWQPIPIQLNGNAQISTVYSAGVFCFLIDSNGGLYFLSINIDYENWMRDLNEVSSTFGGFDLFEVCIPGSHDSGCSSFIAGVEEYAKTQNKSIYQQLKAGCRFLDIRPGYNTLVNNFMIYHDVVPSRLTLNNVVQDIAKFASTHPEEVITVSISHIALNGQPLSALIEIFKPLFNNSFIFGKNTDLADFSINDFTQGRNVIMLTDIDFNPNANYQYFGFNAVTNTPDDGARTYISEIDKYGDTDSVTQLLDFMAKTANEAPLSKLWMLQCQLTAQESKVKNTALVTFKATSFMPTAISAGMTYLTTNVVGSPTRLADQSHDRVINTLVNGQTTLPPDPDYNSLASVNYFIVDSYSEDWTWVAIARNMAKLAMPIELSHEGAEDVVEH
ncbi:phosphatidylinositol-specific phospholipase C domain-containing protein [bacterium SCSIO 12741]|nr:phosphatidylinositol-specific phospholipase C domain-containing protein [bacterium SCSIO 12741]